MKKLDTLVSTAMSSGSSRSPAATLKSRTRSIWPGEAEQRLKRQVELVKAGKRAQIQELRLMSSNSPHLKEVEATSHSVGILVSEPRLRRRQSRLPHGSNCLEGDLSPYGYDNNLDSRDMLGGEPYWATAFATCFLVGKDTVLTARHVFCNDNEAMAALEGGTLRVVFGYEFNESNLPGQIFCRGEQIYCVVATPAFPCPAAPEWIALTLTQDATTADRAPLSIFKGSLSPQTPSYTLGHPNFVSQRFCETDEPLQIQPDYFGIFADAYNGSSGSPVFSVKSHEVIGMVLASSLDDGFIYVAEWDRFLSRLCLPEYNEQATLCLNSAAFAGSF